MAKQHLPDGCTCSLRSPLVRESVKRSQEVTPEVEWVPTEYYAEAQMNNKFKRFRDERVRR